MHVHCITNAHKFNLLRIKFNFLCLKCTFHPLPKMDKQKQKKPLIRKRIRKRKKVSL